MGSPPARSRAFSAAPDGPFSPLLGGCSLPILYVIMRSRPYRPRGTTALSSVNGPLPDRTAMTQMRRKRTLHAIRRDRRS
jgi:hypothetical protein